MPRLLALLLPALLWGPVQAAAPQSAPPTPLRLVLLSDFNGSYGSTHYPPALGRVLGRVLNEWKPALVLSAGDLIAGQKASLSDVNVRAMWAAFERDVRGPLAGAGIPFAFALGNHDASLARDRREAAAYWGAHPPALTYAERAAFPFRYSFTQGALFVAVLDASGPGVDAAQRSWLAAQLATPAARAAAVRLVLGHLPLAGLSREKNRPGEVIRPADALALRAVMERGGVTAYVSGHQAAYYPGRLGGLNVLGSGGIGGRDYVGAPGTARSVVTVLDVVGGEVRLSAYDADTGAAVPATSLPARVDGLGGPVVRVETLR
ncbi:metallophosphoesterase family protein [uncultured Deinococcus sp.]|uniref:metallophosphoesterase family protein n=1 Tax=uncultured Deinococcus sp. TaxID=158789 RepID=UPI003747CF9E